MLKMYTQELIEQGQCYNRIYLNNQTDNKREKKEIKNTGQMETKMKAVNIIVKIRVICLIKSTKCYK